MSSSYGAAAGESWTRLPERGSTSGATAPSPELPWITPGDAAASRGYRVGQAAVVKVAAVAGRRFSGRGTLPRY